MNDKLVEQWDRLRLQMYGILQFNQWMNNDSI